MATGGKKVQEGQLADQPLLVGFISGAHNISVRGSPKVLLSKFVTDD